MSDNQKFWGLEMGLSGSTYLPKS